MTEVPIRISLNKAEVSALRDIRRHGAVANGFEADLLAQILRKVERSERSLDQSWRRFVWEPGDIRITRAGSQDDGFEIGPDAHVARFAHRDELMIEIDRLIAEFEGGE